MTTKTAVTFKEKTIKEKLAYLKKNAERAYDLGDFRLYESYTAGLI